MYDVLHGMDSSDVVHHSTIADGLAGGGDDGAVTNEIIAHHHVELVLVPESEIRLAVREAAESNGLVLEGSAATPYAAIATGLVGDAPRIGFIASGRNIAVDLLRELLAGAPPGGS
jgi:threonine dehydratase